MSDDQTLSILVHGESKIGKTWFGDTAPGPRLILDAEGGNKFTPSKKTVWDPIKGGPPADDGTWESCIVYVRDFDTMRRVYQWLANGEHPFRSVVIDSISEVQQRCIDSITGIDPMKMQDWGELLRQMSALVRQFRDLTVHPTNPLKVVCIIAMTRETDGRKRPFVQGQLSITLPYYIDVIGYLFVQTLDDGTIVRRMLVSPHKDFEAGDRTGRLGDVVDNPTITNVLDKVYKEQ